MRVRGTAAGRALWIWAALCMAGAACAYEDAPQPNLSGILAPDLKKSTHHSVEEVHVNGRFYTFRMDSDFGAYVVPSLALLRIRAAEVETLSQAVSEFERRDQDLSEELHGQFSVRADNAIDIITRPVSTASDLAGQLADNLNQTLSGPAPASGEQGPPAYGAAVADDPVIAMHKRNIAAQWGLDVYSSNPNVQGFLATVASARSAGRISSGAPSFIASAPKRGSIEDAAIDAEVAGLLKSRSADELRRDNAALLAQMQIGSELSGRFLQDTAYSPRHQTRIAHYLNALDGVLNRAGFLDAALGAEDESVALAFEQAAMMLLYYHRHVGRLQKLYSGKDMLQAITMDNRIISMLPVDIVYWSKRTERLFDGMLQRARQAGLSGWEVVVAGDVTQQARQGLQQRKFVVREKFVE